LSFARKTRADDVYTAVTVFISMMTNTRACCFVTAAPEEHLSSLCAFMKNASWVERESSEMLNLVYYNLPDTRKLLLDYSTTRGVLHKCYSDVFSSHFFKIIILLTMTPIKRPWPACLGLLLPKNISVAQVHFAPK
jgi:hypothetical protein